MTDIRQLGGGVVLLNGPANCGKDLIGRRLAGSLMASIPVGDDLNLHEVELRKFAAPIRDHFCYLLGLTDVQLEGLKRSNEPVHALGGMRLRDAMIAFSEAYMKPQYGREIFGTAFIERRNPNEISVVTDSGFDFEINPYLKKYGFDRALAFRLHRDGTSFDGDSRDWFRNPNVKTFDVENNGPVEDAVDQILTTIKFYWDGFKA